jgi:hypothetical protein
MQVHFKVSEGVQAALWLSNAPVESTGPCVMRTNAGCITAAPTVREPNTLNHRVTLTVQGEMLHAGAVLTIDGILARSPMETRCSPELLAAIQELGELATGEITAYLTAGRAVDGGTLEIKDESEET